MSRATELADRIVELYSSQGVTALAAAELRRLDRVNAELVGLSKAHVTRLIEIAQNLDEPRLPMRTVVQTSVRLLAEMAREIRAALTSSKGDSL